MVAERVSQMRGRSATAVYQYGLQLRSIVIDFCRLRYGHAVHGDATLTEDRMQKIIRHGREIRVIQRSPVRICQFTASIEFYT